MAKTAENLTYAAKVHVDLRCESCAWSTGAYKADNAKVLAERHHRRTGHEITGEYGYAVWVGREGKRRLDEAKAPLYKALGLS